MWRVRTIGRGVRLSRLAAAASQCSLPRWTCTMSVSASFATRRRTSAASARGAIPLANAKVSVPGAIVLDQEARLAVDDGLGQGAHPPCDDRTPGRHRLERRATRLVGARGHERETVRRAEDEREVTIAVAGEDDLVHESELGDELLEVAARLAFAHEEEPRRGQLPEEQPKTLEQEVVAAVRSEPGDRDDHRRVAELELVAHRPR